MEVFIRFADDDDRDATKDAIKGQKVFITGSHPLGLQVSVDTTEDLTNLAAALELHPDITSGIEVTFGNDTMRPLTWTAAHERLRDMYVPAVNNQAPIVEETSSYAGDPFPQPEPVDKMVKAPRYEVLPPDQDIQDLLDMVSSSRSLEVVEAWTDEEKMDVANWALAVHLHASDNDDIVVPDKPAVLDVPPMLPVKEDPATTITGDPGQTTDN